MVLVWYWTVLICYNQLAECMAEWMYFFTVFSWLCSVIQPLPANNTCQYSTCILFIFLFQEEEPESDSPCAGDFSNLCRLCGALGPKVSWTHDCGCNVVDLKDCWYFFFFIISLVLHLQVCGGCKMARYCSKEHQALDWKSGHKAECKDPGNNHVWTLFILVGNIELSCQIC